MVAPKRDPSIFVAKFGGTSLADAAKFRHVASIIHNDPRRRYIVVSAPGKRAPDDVKVTDLLIECHRRAERGEEWQALYAQVAVRFRQIAADLGLSLPIELHLRDIAHFIPTNSLDYVSSRGEYLSALIMAELLGYPFIDASRLISFDDAGRLNRKRTRNQIRSVLGAHPRAVIPGFYGRKYGGAVKTFSRGGSDITGSLVACGISAVLYENWTDTPGLYAVDPRIVCDPHTISSITYSELFELAAAGAEVFHEEAVVPLWRTGTPIHIRNTMSPEAPGTRIVPDHAEDLATYPQRITGIAGRRGFAVITLEKARMNKQRGFIRTLTELLERHEVNIDHIPSGKNTLSVVIHRSELDGNGKALSEEISRLCRPERLRLSQDIALIAVVGRGMAYHPGIAGKIFSALGEAGINVRIIDQGASELSIVIGVADTDYEAALRAIYRTFFG